MIQEEEDSDVSDEEADVSGDELTDDDLDDQDIPDRCDNDVSDSPLLIKNPFFDGSDEDEEKEDGSDEEEVDSDKEEPDKADASDKGTVFLTLCRCKPVLRIGFILIRIRLFRFVEKRTLIRPKIE